MCPTDAALRVARWVSVLLVLDLHNDLPTPVLSPLPFQFLICTILWPPGHRLELAEQCLDCDAGRPQ